MGGKHPCETIFNRNDNVFDNVSLRLPSFFALILNPKLENINMSKNSTLA